MKSPENTINTLRQFAPKYRVIAQQLREVLRSGDYQPNQILLSEAQLVEQYGVSRATIREAIDVLVRENLLERRQGKGTFVTAAREQVHQTTLVFSYPDASSLRHPYVASLYHSFEAEVNRWEQQNDREISVQCIRQAPAPEEGHFTLLHAQDPLQAQMIDPRYVQGICLTTTVADEEIAEIVKRGIWCVTIGGPKDYDFPNIYNDPRKTKTLAIEHLVQLGHRDIGLVMAAASLGESEQDILHDLYLSGRKQGLNIGGPFNVICGDYRRELAQEAVAELLLRPQRPTALYCSDDFLALGARDAARIAGLSVPGDLSIVGTGNYVLTENLTTVQTPLRKIGAAAARLLVELVFEKHLGAMQITVNDYKLIPGETTAPVKT